MVSVISRLPGSLIAALAAVFVLAATTTAEARPDYPWKSDNPYALESSQARHHIIPWEELVEFGMTNIATNDTTLQAFLNSYDNIGTANLGSATSTQALVKDFFEGSSEARETVEALFAWMQGNLVVGPKNRSNDPGKAFDTVAFNCRQQVSPDNAYTDLKDNWNAKRLTTFNTLASTAMSPIKTETDCTW
jgi:hypothetical protein